MRYRAQIRLAARALRDDGVIACPTEGVWGLSCDPDSSAAVDRLLELKARPESAGLILVAADLDQFDPYLRHLHWSVRHRLSESWPGATTWVVPDNGRAPNWIRGRHDGVALRASAHPVLRALCDAFGGPLVSTSANRSGRAPARTLWQLRVAFAGRLDVIVPGALGTLAGPTPIRDAIDGTTLRE